MEAHLSQGSVMSFDSELKDLDLWTGDLFEVPRWTMGFPNQSRHALHQSRRRGFLSCLSITPAGSSKEISSRLLFLLFAVPFLFYIPRMFDLTLKSPFSRFAQAFLNHSLCSQILYH